MKTVITTCDQCLLIIHKVDILTGMKYLAEYAKYELNTGGTKREFCSMHCMKSCLDGSKIPAMAAGQEGLPSSADGVGIIPSPSGPSIDEIISEGGPIG